MWEPEGNLGHLSSGSFHIVVSETRFLTGLVLTRAGFLEWNNNKIFLTKLSPQCTGESFEARKSPNKMLQNVGSEELHT